jgi:hypothetical protein
MSASRSKIKRRPPAPRRRGSVAVPGIVLGLILVLAVGFIVAGVRGLGGGETTASGPILARTGEVSSMGVPFVETPGSATGRASASGVEVRGALYDLGTVPLEVAVLPHWTLVNTSGHPVELGEPTPEVLDGCCPGPFTFGTRTLEPGASTTLTFELAMHPGMDGWHDIAVHVPLRTANGEDVLSLEVIGDFRGQYTG